MARKIGLLGLIGLIEDKPVVNLVIFAADTGGGQKGLIWLVLGVGGEEGLDGESHLTLFFWGDTDKSGALLVGITAIFDLSEENLVISGGN